jgi:hypothetical protein
MSRHATVADFNRWEEMAKSMTDAQLRYAELDSFRTAANWRGVDPVVEGFYMDQGCTYGDALRFRTRR